MYSQNYGNIQQICEKKILIEYYDKKIHNFYLIIIIISL